MWKLIKAYHRRSVIIILAMALLLIGGTAPIAFPWGLLVSLGTTCVVIALYWMRSDSIVLRRAGVVNHRSVEYQHLYNIVQEMCIASGLGVVPRVVVIKDPAPNAFAFGRKPKCSTVAVTSGLLVLLSRDELQGVVAHECAHIKNRDVQFMTFAAVLLSVAVILTEFCETLIGWSMRVARSGFALAEGESGNLGGGRLLDEFASLFRPHFLVMALGALLVLVFLLALLPVFLMGQLVQRVLYFACSRKREFLADACAVQYTRYPEGLASALEKISNANTIPRFANLATVPLFIVNPFRVSWRGRFDGLFTTHPPTLERIAILRSMAGPNLDDYEKAYQQTTHRPLVLR